MLFDDFRRLLAGAALLAAGLLTGPAAHAGATEPFTDEDIKRTEAEVASMDSLRRFGIAEAPARTEGALRIATYNLMNLFTEDDAGENAEPKPLHELVAVARAIRAIDADILLLQEVGSLGSLEWFRDRFLDGMGYDHAAAPDAGDLRGIRQAVLSRHPITDTQVWPGKELGGVHPELYGTQPNWHAGEPVAFRRSPLRADIAIPDPETGEEATRIITFFVVHHKAGRFSAYWREAEAKALLKLVEEVAEAHPERPVFIAGDFNALATDESVRTYLRAGFHDIFAEHPRDNRVVSHESGRRIDMILANRAALPQVLSEKAFVLGTAARPEGINWRDLPTLPGLASDHYPVVVEKSLRPIRPTGGSSP
ncbi:MAG: endonuclease/exonuclease/phosphatase family protein [Phycisphaerales bacterium]|nr:endonuclease/exonuclease/phosphatase family protein [Phycisphaerales bacterium]